MVKIDMNKLQNYYKIYCNKTKENKRLFKQFDEFAYVISRVGMIPCLRDFNRKNFNIKKLHDKAKFLLCFGDEEAFQDADPDNIVPKCETLIETLELVRNKNKEKILHE